ncbi:MAG: TlpA disulfide reductase family protein [Planctomycetota bacterium]
MPRHRGSFHSSAPLYYKHKRKFTTEEWQAIVDEHETKARRASAAKAKKDSRIGSRAAALPKKPWVNSEGLSWNKLRGRVVVLAFGAYWCGPCQNDYPILENWHQGRKPSGVDIVAVHTPTSSLKEVKGLVRKHKISYPMVVDEPKPEGGSGFGKISSWFHVDYIPYYVVVDQTGQVAGHGSLVDALQTARKTVAKKPSEKIAK